MKSKFWQASNVKNNPEPCFAEKVKSMISDIFPSVEIPSALFSGDVVAIGINGEPKNTDFEALPLYFEWTDEYKDESECMVIEQMYNHIKRIHRPEKIIFRLADTFHDNNKNIYKSVIRLAMVYKS